MTVSRKCNAVVSSSPTAAVQVWPAVIGRSASAESAPVQDQHFRSVFLGMDGRFTTRAAGSDDNDIRIDGTLGF